MGRHSQPTVPDLAEALARRYRPTIAKLRRRAAAEPWDGGYVMGPEHGCLMESPEESGKALSVRLTFDVGYHNSGWWRNSDYDRCWHLSTVVVKEGKVWLPGAPDRRAFETPTDREWQAIARAFFGEDVVKAWIEPPASVFDSYRNAPASPHCYHVRLFVDRKTGEPILPEGEVYLLKPWPEGDSPAKVFRS